MRSRRFPIYLLALTAVLLIVSSFSVFAASVPRMSSDELKSHIGEENFVILDVRANGDWAAADDKISGALRVAPNSVEQWADNLDKDKTIVLYCA